MEWPRSGSGWKRTTGITLSSETDSTSYRRPPKDVWFADSFLKDEDILILKFLQVIQLPQEITCKTSFLLIVHFFSEGVPISGIFPATLNSLIFSNR